MPFLSFFMYVQHEELKVGTYCLNFCRRPIPAGEDSLGEMPFQVARSAPLHVQRLLVPQGNLPEALRREEQR